MTRFCIAAAAAVGVMVLPGSAMAETISQTVRFASIGAGGAGVGQTFTATLNGHVTTIRVARAGYNPPGTPPAVLRVYAGDAGAVGQPLAEALFDTTTDPSGSPDMQSIDLPSPIPVSAGAKYSFSLSGASYWMSGNDAYPGGSIFLAPANMLPYDLAFEVVQVAPTPTPVPTMSEWAMILLSLTLAGGAVCNIQRRRLA